MATGVQISRHKGMRHEQVAAVPVPTAVTRLTASIQPFDHPAAAVVAD
jgi:hypothetical protein